MSRDRSYLLVALVALSASPNVASAAVYINSGNVGATGTYNLSITTDDTIGVITSSNILTYQIAVANETSNFTLTPSNSAKLFSGSGLTATATDLLFNFSGAGFALFQSPTSGSGGPFFCFQVNGCFDEGGGGTGLAPVSINSFQFTRLQGTQVVASVSGAVPEPGTWALMLLGFGGMGIAFRRRQRSILRRPLAV